MTELQVNAGPMAPATKTLPIALGAIGIVGASIFLSSAPIKAILGDGPNAISGAIHGISASMLLLSGTVGAYLAARLIRGKSRTLDELRWVTTAMATFSLFTIISGNWIYIAYRAKVPTSPRSYFLSTSPEVHKVFFEFKEFSTLFTLPLAVVAAYLLWRHGERILERVSSRTIVSILIFLHFFYLIGGYGLGAAVTKLKGI